MHIFWGNMFFETNLERKKYKKYNFVSQFFFVLNIFNNSQMCQKCQKKDRNGNIFEESQIRPKNARKTPKNRG
jgi:deoxyadenosine/deoxycytidine kinase